MLDPLPWLTEARLARRGLYTGLPIEAIQQYIERLDLSDEERAQALASVGEPDIRMTCPVCGQSSTHLVLCKGCGGGSFEHLLEGWNGEEPDPPPLKEAQSAFQKAMDGFGEAAEHAARQVYHTGGCMICERCWDGTLVNWQECPVNLFEDAEGWMFRTLMHLGNLVRQEGLDPREDEGLCQVTHLLEGEIANLRFRWCEGWNWGEVEEQQEAIARWREALFEAALERHFERLEGRRAWNGP